MGFLRDVMRDGFRMLGEGWDAEGGGAAIKMFEEEKVVDAPPPVAPDIINPPNLNYWNNKWSQ